MLRKMCAIIAFVGYFEGNCQNRSKISLRKFAFSENYKNFDVCRWYAAPSRKTSKGVMSSVTVVYCTGFDVEDDLESPRGRRHPSFNPLQFVDYIGNLRTRSNTGFQREFEELKRLNQKDSRDSGK